MSKDSGWWTDFFPVFRPVFDRLSPKNANALVGYLIERLDLKPGRKFLDCPCGIGRIALPLARKGIRVTGVDIIPSYLEEVSRRADRRGLKITLQHSDMRRISFDREFDAAGNIWTSFGYFEKESDNRLTLRKMYQALRPGGKFLLHLTNRDWIMANFIAQDWFETGRTKVLQTRTFDYATSTLHDTWHFIADGREVAHDCPIRLYTYHELLVMMQSVGFADIKGFGSLKDEPISRDKRMMYIIGTRPKYPARLSGKSRSVSRSVKRDALGSSR